MDVNSLLVTGEFYSKDAIVTGVTGEGRIFWNLPVRTQYTPGIELGCNLTISNITTGVKTYTIIARTIKNGIITSENTVLVNGNQWFTLEAGQTIEVLGSLTLLETDCYLELSLYEESSEEIVSNCLTYLYEYEAAVAALYESMAASTIINNITNIVSVAVVLTLGVFAAKGMAK